MNAHQRRHVDDRPALLLSHDTGCFAQAKEGADKVDLDAVAPLLDIDIGNIQAFSPSPLVIGDRVVAPLAMALLGVKIPTAEPEATPP